MADEYITASEQDRKRDAQRERKRARNAAWQASHPEKARAYSKAWRARNREQIKERNATWREQNRDKVKALTKAWREQNREHVLAYEKARIRLHPKSTAPIKAWRAKNPEKVRAQQIAKRHIPAPDTCQRCGAQGLIHRHHPDYSRPLLVEFLCPACHALTHRELRRRSRPRRWVLILEDGRVMPSPFAMESRP
jgi:hypothetical protein